VAVVITLHVSISRYCIVAHEEGGNGRGKRRGERRMKRNKKRWRRMKIKKRRRRWRKKRRRTPPCRISVQVIEGRTGGVGASVGAQHDSQPAHLNEIAMEYN